MSGWKELVTAQLFVLLGIADLKGQVTWQTAIGGFGSDAGNAVRQTNDDGFIICGSTGSFGQGGDVYLIKLDAGGVREWTKAIGGTGVDFGAAVKQLPDSGYVLVGSTELGSGYDGLVVRLDKEGEVQWQRTIGTLDWDLFADVEALPDGYVVVGKTHGLGAGGSDAWILKFNLFGDTLWSRRFGFAQEDEARCVRLTADGGFVVAGTTTGSFGNQDALLIKYDVGGTEEWNTIMRGESADVGLSVSTLADGGYLLGGHTRSLSANQDLFFAKTNSGGDSLWMRGIGGGGVDWVGGEVRELSDGRLTMVGTTAAFGAGGKDAYLVFTDSQGYWVFGPSFGGVSDDYGVGLDLTADGGYILAGSTTSFGQGQSSVFVIKTDGDTLNFAVTEDLDPLYVSTAEPHLVNHLNPNPVSTGGFLRVMDKGDPIRRMTFVDLAGRVVAQEEVQEGEHDVHVPDIPGGMYSVQMKTSSGKLLNSLLVVLQGPY